MRTQRASVISHIPVASTSDLSVPVTGIIGGPPVGVAAGIDQRKASSSVISTSSHPNVSMPPQESHDDGSEDEDEWGVMHTTTRIEEVPE